MNSYHYLGKSASAVGKENFVVSPYSTRDGAMVGGLGGAAIGGLAGLGKAVFDSEDDGIGSTLRKLLTGVGAGGLTGAGLGAAASSGLRGKAVEDAAAKVTEITGKPTDERARAGLDLLLRRFKLPLTPLVDSLTGKRELSGEDYNKEVQRTALIEALAQAGAPVAAGLAGKQSTTTVVRE
jgi:hypothetical protein